MSKTKKKTEKLPILYHIDDMEVKSFTPIGITKDTVYVGLYPGSCYKIKEKFVNKAKNIRYRCFDVTFYVDKTEAHDVALAQLVAARETTEYKLKKINEAIKKVKSKSSSKNDDWE